MWSRSHSRRSSWGGFEVITAAENTELPTSRGRAFGRLAAISLALEASAW